MYARSPENLLCAHKRPKTLDLLLPACFSKLPKSRKYSPSLNYFVLTQLPTDSDPLWRGFLSYRSTSRGLAFPSFDVAFAIHALLYLGMTRTMFSRSMPRSSAEVKPHFCSP